MRNWSHFVHVKHEIHIVSQLHVVESTAMDSTLATGGTLSEKQIIVNLDVMLAKRKMKLKELAALVGISEQNMSVLKSGKSRAVRFSTLSAICEHLRCQPGDLLVYDTMEPFGEAPKK